MINDLVEQIGGIKKRNIGRKKWGLLEVKKEAKGNKTSAFKRIIQMTNFIKCSAAVFPIILAFIWFSSCSHQKLANGPDFRTEIWEMQITGETEAIYKMQLRRIKIDKESYSIKGEFSGMAVDHIGGGGMVKCSFKGKVAGNNLKAEFKGQADMEAWLSLTGSFSGTLSHSIGSGEWWVIHEQGRSEGQWTMKRNGSH